MEACGAWIATSCGLAREFANLSCLVVVAAAAAVAAVVVFFLLLLLLMVLLLHVVAAAAAAFASPLATAHFLVGLTQAPSPWWSCQRRLLKGGGVGRMSSGN